MVFRHARAPYSDFVLLFHMAIFFIASGWLLNLKYAMSANSLWIYFKKKLKALWLPYFGFNATYILLNNVFLKLNIYTDNPEFLKSTGVEQTYLHLSNAYGVTDTIKELVRVLLFQGGTEMGGALWFFNTMFFLVVDYMIVQFLLQKVLKNGRAILIAQTVIALIGLAAGYYCHLHIISAHGLNRVASYYILIHLGVLLRQYHVMEKIEEKYPIIATVGALVVLLLCYHRGTIDLSGNNIENPAFFLIVSIAGWFLLYGIGTLLEKVLGQESKFNRAIQYISIHSVPIIGLHFLAFKIVNALAVHTYGMKSYMIAAFPVLMTTGAWWILYTIVGICVPLAADRVWIKVKKIVLIHI